MYIYLDKSLIVDEKDTEFEKVKKAIKYLVLGYLEGNHLLDGDLEVLCYYKNAFSNGDDYTYSGLSELCGNYSNINVPKNISFYVEVVKNDVSEIDLFRIENGITIKKIKYDYFKTSKKIQRTNFIVEDLSDADFYDYVCKCKLSGKDYNFEPIDGSGAKTIEKVRKYAYKQKEITFSIIDTDKKYAEDMPQKITEFEKECNKIKQKNTTIFDYTIIDAHEIENLIPIEIIDKLDYKVGGQQDNKTSFDLISKSKLSNEILQFFDLKQGIYKIKAIYDNPNYKKYIKLIISLKPELLTPYNNNFETYYEHIETVDGKKGTIDNNKGKIFPGLRRDLLTESLKYIDQNLDSLLTPALLEYQEKEWDRISKFIYTMCCCYVNKEARNS